jgi:hypothetical protein
LRKTAVHAKKHRDPVAGFRAAGAGINAKNRVILIKLAAEQGFKFQLLDILIQGIDIACKLRKQLAIVFLQDLG